MPVLVGVVIMYAAERIGVVLAGAGRGQYDGVIGSKSCRGVDLVRVSSAQLNSLFCARDKEGAAAVEDVEALEVHVGAIHDVEGTWLWRDDIEDVDVVQFSCGNLNESGDGATHVEQGVHLDRSLLGPE